MKEQDPTHEQRIARLEARIEWLTDLLERLAYELAQTKAAGSTGSRMTDLGR